VRKTPLDGAGSPPYRASDIIRTLALDSRLGNIYLDPTQQTLVLLELGKPDVQILTFRGGTDTSNVSSIST